MTSFVEPHRVEAGQPAAALRRPGAVPSTSTLTIGSPVSSTRRHIGSICGHRSGTASSIVRPICSADREAVNLGERLVRAHDAELAVEEAEADGRRWTGASRAA